jgi:outer membrane receptor for ferrienterochelin and colicins
MAKRTAALLLISLVVAVTPGRIRAQDKSAPPDVMDMSLEDLLKVEIDSVYGASGYKQKITDAPASITIVTASEIRRYGYRTLADILRSVPGFYVTRDRNYSYLGERGFGRPGDYNSRILLLVDGHWSNDNLFNQALLGTEFPIDVDLIERVEVIRGPNSSVYNASAFLGVINVVTKTARELEGLTLSEELASYGAYKSRVTYGRQFDNGLQMLLSSTYNRSHGHDSLYFKEFDRPATNHGIAENIDHGRFAQLFASLSYGNFRLEGAYASREKQIPTASFGTIFNDPGENTVDAPGYLDLKYDHHFGADWGYMSRLYYDDYTYTGASPVDYSQSGGPARVLNRDSAVGRDWGAEFALSKKLFDGQTLIVGSEYRDNFTQNQSNYDVEPYYQYLNSRQSSTVWSVYAQDEIPLRRGLVLDLGLRYDHYSTFGGTTNPRAALIYEPLEKTTLKLLYGQSFRAPNAYELYYEAEGQEPNPRLKPETVRTMEMVLEQDLKHQFRFVVSGYYYPIRGLISAATDPASGAIIYKNSQRVDLKGIEFTLKRQSRSGLEAGVSLSLQQAKDVDTGGPLTNSPRVLGQANLSVPLLNRKLFASVNLEYVSRRRTLAGNYAGAYILPNFTLLSQGALRRWEVSASLYNAFNGIYGDPGSIEHLQDVILQDGRNFRVKLTYHF